MKRKVSNYFGSRLAFAMFALNGVTSVRVCEVSCVCCEHCAAVTARGCVRVLVTLHRHDCMTISCAAITMCTTHLTSY